MNSSLGRLKSACNPESGTIAYGYDGNGNLTLKTDARSVTTTFSYDALNRLTGKGYAGETVTAPDTATPNVTYAYEGGKDFRTAVTTSAGSYEVGGFDALGRPSVAVQRAGAQNFTFSNLQWAAMGQMVSMTYPSGRVASYSYDRAGRPSGLTGKVNASAAAETYASAVSYAPHGAMTGLVTGDNVTHSRGYDERLRMKSAQATGLMTLTMGWSAGGNLLSQRIQRPGLSLDVTQNFQYDSLNRLCAAVEASTASAITAVCGTTPSGANWKQTYIYDQAGNRALTGTSTSAVSDNSPHSDNGITVPFDGSNHWLLAADYDLAGNMIRMRTQTMDWDAESRLKRVKDAGALLASFTYDGDGRRLTKTANGKIGRAHV